MSIQALIFDVDGTLADTEDGHRRAFNQAFAETGIGWHWDVPLYDRLLAVAGGKERIRYYVDGFLGPWTKPADYEGFVKELHAVKTRHYTALVRGGQIPLRPGIGELIRRAHAARLKLGVATTTAPDNVAALLEVGLGPEWGRYFDAIGCGDVVPHKKPAPDVYHWVLDKLGLSAADCIALEDSTIGLTAARAAGLRTFVTTNAYTERQDFGGAAAVYPDLSDLGRFLRDSGLNLPELHDGTA